MEAAFAEVGGWEHHQNEPNQLNNLLRQYAQMRKMFKDKGKASFGRKLAGMKFPGMKNLTL